MPALTNRTTKVRPFLKWAGGKTQLLPEIRKRFPSGLTTGGIKRYIEPFVGSGAVFFDVAQTCPLQEYLLLDANPDLVTAYRAIQAHVQELIDRLTDVEQHYHSLSLNNQRDYFYQTRDMFNERKQQQEGSTERAAQLLFLNKTCFNGLFRVNSRGLFNVPFGQYSRPTICNTQNLLLVSRVLQHAEIRAADFESCETFVDDTTFVYFDPPYRPLGGTAHFTSYAASTFDDREQQRLAAFFRNLDARGGKLMLSNSDPKNKTPDDDFFERAYAKFTIERVKARRTINSNATRRGPINELIITNYADTVDALRS